LIKQHRRTGHSHLVVSDCLLYTAIGLYYDEIPAAASGRNFFFMVFRRDLIIYG